MTLWISLAVAAFIESALNTIARNNPTESKTTLITFGTWHKYWFLNQLLDRIGSSNRNPHPNHIPKKHPLGERG